MLAATIPIPVTSPAFQVLFPVAVVIVFMLGVRWGFDQVPSAPVGTAGAPTRAVFRGVFALRLAVSCAVLGIVTLIFCSPALSILVTSYRSFDLWIGSIASVHF